TDTAGGIATFSARGPQRGNQALKVDIAAPGVGLRSAATATGIDAVAISGTAAAAAQVGGAAALLRQLHSGWVPAQIKAALTDTATPINAPPSLAGGGQLNLAGLDTVSLLAH